MHQVYHYKKFVLYLINNNLVDYPAGLSIAGADSCTAQVNSTCEAGADYVWYTVTVCVGEFACNAQPPLENYAKWSLWTL
jgi:hypothetical protein